jgi:hypothetical protein
MLIMSGIFGLAALIVEPVYLIDWWRPLTIFGTSVGLEDFFFGAAMGGVASSGFEILFKQRLRAPVRSQKHLRNDYILYASLGTCGALFFSAVTFGMSSFFASIISLGVPTLYIWYLRRDLIINSFVSGVFMGMCMAASFVVVEFVTPGWVDTHWLHSNLSGIILVSAPFEDLVWAFFVGTFVGPLYEFWREQPTVPLRKR